MLSQLDGRPRLDAATAVRLLAEHWGIDAQVRPLASERDQNWLVVSGGSPAYVLKVANRADGADLVDFQQQMMARLAGTDVPCPKVVRTATGAGHVRAAGHTVWVICHLPGTTLAALSPVPASVHRHLGRVLGAAARAWEGFDHPAAHRNMQWNVRSATQVLGAYRDDIAETSRRGLVDETLAAFSDRVVPVLDDLPHAVIHNDANDHNVLVTGDRVTGLLDFGDAVWAPVVNEVAVGCAYAMLDADDPHTVADAVVSGFGQQRPLSPAERAVLPDLIRVRLATSVAISAHQQRLDPDDPYLRVSEEPAWRLLARLSERR